MVSRNLEVAEQIYFQYATVLVLLLIAQVAIGIVVLVRIKSDDDYSFKDAIHNETSTLFGKYSTSRDNNAIHVVQYSVSELENPGSIAEDNCS